MLTAHDWARYFVEKQVPIHTFVVAQRPDTTLDFQTISDLSGGQSGRLDGSDAVTDMVVMAILSRLTSVDRGLLRFLNADAVTVPLAADNVGLGMARAVAVAKVLRSVSALGGLTILPLSAYQTTIRAEELSVGDGLARGDEERRQIEIRLRHPFKRQ